MKISKLFHWLYALVMLLPMFAIGTTCAYAIFNKNAYQSYADYEQEQVSDVSLNTRLVEGQTYYLNPLPYSISINTTYYEVLDNRTNIQEIYFPDNSDLNYITKFAMATSGDRTRLIAYGSNNTNYSVFDMTESFYFVSNGTNELNTQNPSPYTITTLTYTTGKVSDVFYYAIDKVTESPLFSWAYDSFLSVPFVYITNLFSIPSNSVIIELLSYWLAISIIWLVFDLIMYIPLLVHRWIDKGVIE